MLAIFTDGPIWHPLIQQALDERRIARADVLVTTDIEQAVAGGHITAILALGDTALLRCYNASDTVTAIRGFMLPSRFGMPVVATYAPFYLTPRRGAPGQTGSAGAMHLFGVFMRDLQFAYDIATNGAPKLPETTYALNPTDTDIRDFLDYLRGDGSRPVAYDIETAAILGVRGEEADAIVQVQFSAQPATALVLAWDDRGIDATRAIMALSNPKWDWNGRLFDRQLLRRNSINIAGEAHDLMHVWGHLQPSFGTGRDDPHGDKGVPSRLMGLQSATSFFVPGARPWKHLNLPDWQYDRWRGLSLPLLLRLYGGRDVDYTYRCGVGLFNSLVGAGLEAGYRIHKYELCKALDAISAHGLPINRTKQAELRAFTEAELSRLSAAMQLLAPENIRGIHPKGGYAKAKYELGSYVKLKTAEGMVVEREFGWPDAPVAAVGVDRASNIRQCLLKPFNPGSKGERGQIGAYIHHMGYPMPTKIDDPTKGTTGKDALRQLADDTGDKLLDLICQYTDLRKIGLDYTGGKWEPGVDGRVHSTFKPNTASGQLTSSDPNIQQFPDRGDLAKQAKAMIAAEPGFTFVKADYRGFHSKVIGWLANDPGYYKLADFDVHSYLVAIMLHLQGAEYLLELPDDELRTELGIIKRMHEDARKKVKAVVHGSQFGLGVRKLYRMHPKHFRDESDARQLKSLLESTFPAVFIHYPQQVREQIYHKTRGRIVTPHSCIRYFFDYDMEQATAFGPSNAAHCEFQRAKIRLYKSGALERYGCCNSVHDSLWFLCPDGLVDQCIKEVTTEMSKPSDILVEGELGPFYCNVDIEVGADMAHMK